MDHKKRMKEGLLYLPMDESVLKEQFKYLDLLTEYNNTLPSNTTLRQKLLREMFGDIGDRCYVEAPLRANFGCKHVHFGNHVYANFNLTLVDDGHIYVSDDVMFGPNVTIITAAHPINAKLRKIGYQYNRDVYIGENAWIGACATILAGVHIGKNTIIGAGSVVTHDIPDGVVAVGVPCKVLRKVNENDDIYYYKDQKIDWENIEE